MKNKVLESVWCLLQIRNKIYFPFLILLFLAACRGSSKPPQPVVFRLQQIGKLATAEYTVTRLIKGEDNQTWYKIGDRKILLSCTAFIKAGIDFTQLQAQQVTEKEEKVFVQLPAPQIISFNMPPQNIKVEYTDVGLFRDPFSTAETNAIMRTAESQMQRQLTQLDILTTARSNATAFVTRFLTAAGFKEVYVSFQ